MGEKTRYTISFSKPSLGERKSVTLALLTVAFHPKAQESCIVVIVDQKSIFYVSFTASLCFLFQVAAVLNLLFHILLNLMLSEIRRANKIKSL